MLASLAGFALALPRPIGSDFIAYLRYFGASGLFIAILACAVAGGWIALLRLRTKPVLADWMGAALALLTFAALAATHVSLPAIIAAAMHPIARLGDTYLALMVIVAIETILWTAGVHGPAMLAAIVTPVYLTMQMQNTHAFTLHAPLPYIVVVSLFLFVFPGGRRRDAAACGIARDLEGAAPAPRGTRDARAGNLQSQRAAALRRAGRLQSAFGSAVRLCSARPRNGNVRCRRGRIRIARRLLRAVIDPDVRLDIRCNARPARDRARRVQYRARNRDMVSVRARLRTPHSVVRHAPEERGCGRCGTMIEQICERFGIGGRVRDAAVAAYERTATFSYDAQRRVALNVLRAFLDEGIAESDLGGLDGIRLRR